MLEKIEIGKTYLNSDKHKVKVLFIDDRSVFYEFLDGQTRTFINNFFALANWSKLPKPKKRYWLWDVKTADNGHIFKSNVYLDDDGFATNRVNIYLKYQLIKKHESEFVDIEEN